MKKYLPLFSLFSFFILFFCRAGRDSKGSACFFRTMPFLRRFKGRHEILDCSRQSRR